MTRTIILAGAPESNKLDWNEKSLLPAEHVENAKPRGSMDSTTGSDSDESLTMNKPSIPKWRRLEMERLKMRPILPKLNIDPPPTDIEMSIPAEFLETSELVAQELLSEPAGSDVSTEDSRPSVDSSTREYEPETQALADFYDHSFSIHEAIPSSQIESQQSITPGTPVATYLDSINPQTKTVNLIVGIVSIAPSRIVTTGAKFGKPRQVELIELLVGDETKTGFSITMWLPREMHVNWKDGAQEKPEGSRSVLRRSLKAVQMRDVVLIQNVALSTFRGKVHGQSLRGDVTRIDTLFRKKVGDEEQVGCYTAQNLRMATGKDAQILKVKRVKDWMLDFVGEAPDATTTKKKGRRVRMMPDDTQ
ncbi:hypothetical protein LTR51_005860 [Lithohypha guttulata]|nr:hypothetical protein LTR51_005860 [Lithohypha guttulata]